MAPAIRRVTSIWGSYAEPLVPGKFCDLNEMERTWHMFYRATPIDTATWYSGSVSMSYLRGRLEQVLLENPWLACRLVTQRGSRRVRLWIPDDPLPHMDGMLEQLDDIQVSDPRSCELNFLDLLDTLRPCTVGKGPNLLNLDKPLFKISVLRSGTPGRGVVVFSMSHILGDGPTYYNVLGMFNETTKPFRMSYERIAPSFDDWVGNAVGKDMLRWRTGFFATLGCLFYLFYTTVILKWLLRRNRNLRVLVVSNDWISEMKKQQKKDLTGVEYISSNDIITSEVASRCDVDILHMVLNLRGRRPDVSNDFAGNQVNGVTLWKDDVGAPHFIRKALTRKDSTFMGARTDVPSRILTLTTLRRMMITNWGSVSKEVVLPGALPATHIPVVRIPRSIGLPLNTVGVIFRLSREEYAVLILSMHNKRPLSQDALSSVLFASRC